MEWVLLSYKLPSEPSAVRVRVWRKLKRLGALLLHDTLWVLPATARTREQFQWLAVEIRDRGGEATAWAGEALLADQETPLLEALQAQVAPAYQDMLEALAGPAPDLPALARRYQQTVAQHPALIVRSVHRIASHALNDRWLWAIAIASGIATALNTAFLIPLAVAGLAYLLALFGYGLRTGLLTFGGAYTAIPFLQHDAVAVGGWMPNAQFVDRLALSGILPAPLIIFTTFVGYLGGGLGGAVALTAGAFLPAFSFTLLGHRFFERVIANPAVHTLLDGVTAGVVGLIAVTSARIIWAALPTTIPLLILTALIFGAGLVVLYRWKSKLAVLAVVLGAGMLGTLSLLL